MVTLLLAPLSDGTRVTMEETAGDTLSKLAINPLTDWLVHLRNVESLRRLKRIAETGVVEAPDEPQARQGRRRRSASSARAAERPPIPCTEPPGWTEAPVTYSPGSGVR